MEKFDISPVAAVAAAAARAAPDSPAAAAAAHIGPQNILNKILFKRHLTMSIYLIVLDGRNPAIPAAEKKRRQRLKMSQEKKDTQREKERLSKNAKRQEENQEESDKHRKINCECMKR